MDICQPTKEGAERPLSATLKFDVMLEENDPRGEVTGMFWLREVCSML